MRLYFIGDHKFHFRIFFLTRNEINYCKPLIKNESTINEEDDLQSQFYYTMVKTLTNYDIQSSSLVWFIN